MAKASINVSTWLVVLLMVVATVVVALVGRQSHGDSTMTTSRSVYEWRPFAQLDTPTYSQQLRQMKRAGFSQLYLSLMDNPQLVPGGAPPSQAQAVTAYTARLSTFLNRVHQAGFTIHALGGDPSWITPPDRGINAQLIQYAIDYDNDPTHTVKITGVQLDDEPWTTKNFMKNYDHLVGQYLDTVKYTINYKGLKTAPPSFAVGFTMPFAYTGTAKSVKPITYDGKSAYASRHVLDLLNARPHSYVSFLDYRNYTKGSDGSVAHLSDVMNYAQHNAKNVKIVVAHEVTNVQPPKITFYGQHLSDLQGSFNAIADKYGHNPQFSGFAVEDAAGLTALLNRH